jgi:trimethylamine-N-oxide reductase (cytochrome c)
LPPCWRASRRDRRDPGQFTDKQWQGITQSMFPRTGLDEDEQKLVMDFLMTNAKR